MSLKYYFFYNQNKTNVGNSYTHCIKQYLLKYNKAYHNVACKVSQLLRSCGNVKLKNTTQLNNKTEINNDATEIININLEDHYLYALLGY